MSKAVRRRRTLSSGCVGMGRKAPFHFLPLVTPTPDYRPTVDFWRLRETIGKFGSTICPPVPGLD